jgi:hypothetical protein
VRGREIARDLFVLICGASRKKARPGGDPFEQGKHSDKAHGAVADGEPPCGVAGDIAERKSLIVVNATLVEFLEQPDRIRILVENSTVGHSPAHSSARLRQRPVGNRKPAQTAIKLT